MGTGLIIGLVLLGIVGVVFLWLIATYNSLVGLREGVKTAWAQIDVMLKRRYDLIPNLVETVKGYASHEKETLERVMQARNAAVAATGQGPGAVSQAEGALAGALRQLFAVVEAYPNLKADQSFLSLQRELSDTENQIAGKRSSFNDTARQYNTRIMSFPANLVAGVFGFRSESYFEVKDAEQRDAPKVTF